MWFVEYYTNDAQYVPYESELFNTKEEAIKFANSLSDISKILGIVIADYENDIYEILDCDITIHRDESNSMWIVQHCINIYQNMPYEEGPFESLQAALEFARDLSELSKLYH